LPTRDESWPNGTPCWADASVDDLAAASAFYSALFGWETQQGPPETGGYTMCLLNGRPAAAIGPKQPGETAPSAWSTYLAADDLDATVSKAKQAGGQFMMEPMDVMTLGRMTFGTDPSGAGYGIWQARDFGGVGIYNEPGALVWNELMTRDYEGAKAFYASVFGYTYEEVGGGSYSTLKLAGSGDIVGGLGALETGTPADVPPSWGAYFMVEDCDASVAKAVELGASVVRAAADTPFGRMATVTGPEGEAFSLIAPPPMDGSAGASAEA
jgi:uncharacterized protein